MLKLCRFHWTWMFITMFTRAHHQFLLWASPCCSIVLCGLKLSSERYLCVCGHRPWGTSGWVLYSPSPPPPQLLRVLLLNEVILKLPINISVCFRFVQMIGTVVTLLLLVVQVSPQERPPISDIDPKRQTGSDWSLRNPQQWDNNVIINEAWVVTVCFTVSANFFLFLEYVFFFLDGGDTNIGAKAK
jgi:hypothetical protein